MEYLIENMMERIDLLETKVLTTPTGLLRTAYTYERDYLVQTIAVMKSTKKIEDVCRSKSNAHVSPTFQEVINSWN